MSTLSIINAAVFDGVSDTMTDGPVHIAGDRIVSVGGSPQPADQVIDARTSYHQARVALVSAQGMTTMIQ